MNLLDLMIAVRVEDEASDKLDEITKGTIEKSKTVASHIGDGLAKAAKLGLTAMTTVGGGISALTTYATKVGSAFESQMSTVSAISGATGEDFEALKEKAEQLGVDTKFSATEAGQAFEYMAMAGWKTQQMLDGVSGIMDLAAASGENLATVSDIVTDAMTAFGMAASESTRFADVLAAASSNANTNVSMLGESFKYVAPVAGAMNYTIEETATALGIMANAGIKGSQAGTALRAAISNLVDPTEKTVKALEDLGLAQDWTVTAVQNADGSSKSFAETLGLLRESFSQLTETQQASYASTIFGREAMSGMLAIINTSEEEYQKLAEAINNAEGSSKAMADIMANNLVGQFTLLQSSAEGFGLALYEHMQTPLTEVVSTGVESLNQLTTSFKTDGVDGMVEAAGLIIGSLVSTITEKLPEFIDLSVSVLESLLQGISTNLDTIAGGAAEIVTSLLGGMLELLPEIVAIGLDLLVSLAEGITEALPELIPTVVSVILQIVDTLTDPENLSELLKAALTLLETLAFGLVDAIPELAGAAVDLIVGLAEFLLKAENLELLVGTAVKVVVALAGGLISAIPEIATSAVQLIDSLIAEFTNTDWLQVGKNLVNEIWDGIKEVWESLTRWFSEAWDNVTGIFDGWFGDDDDDRGRTPRYASGTPYHPGGLAWVGEEGPELVELPRGTRVYSSGESADMIAGGGDVVNNYYTFNVDAEDIRELNDLVRIAESARVDLRISGNTR